MAIGGDTNAIYRGKSSISDDDLPVEEIRTPLGMLKLRWGQRHATGDLNKPTQLGIKKETPLGIQTLRRGTESVSRG